MGPATRAAGVSTVVGVLLGYWLFGPPGAVLFGSGGALVGGASALAFRRAPRAAGAVALAMAACLFVASATLGWGAADAPDGSRYKASPVGLSHVLTPDRPVSDTEDCGWWAASGYRAPCPVTAGEGAAYRALRTVYPLVLVAAGLAVLGAVASLRRPGTARRAVAVGAALAVPVAIALFAWSAPRALAALADLPFGVGGTLGTLQAVAGVLLCLATALAPTAAVPDSG
jgi:hypothetical protein